MSGSSLSFCMVTTFYPPHNFGGDGIYVHRLSNELARRGHRVTVVSAPDAHELLGGTAGVAPAEHGNVTLEPIEPRLGRVSPLVTYLSGRPGLRARQLGELFAREHFDVIHFHNVSLVGGPGVLAYGEGVKLYTTHEHWLVCPMHTLWRNQPGALPRAQVPALHSCLPQAAAALALRLAARARVASRRSLPRSEPVHDRNAP